MIFPGAERFCALMHEMMRYVKVFGLLVFRLTCSPLWIDLDIYTSLT
jgi:hypothetical protein